MKRRSFLQFVGLGAPAVAVASVMAKEMPTVIEKVKTEASPIMTNESDGWECYASCSCVPSGLSFSNFHKK